VGPVSGVTALTPPKSQGASSKPRRHDTDAQLLGSPQGAMDGKMDLRCSDVHRRDPFPSLLTILPSNTRLPSDAASPACAAFPGCTPCVSLAKVSQPPPPCKHRSSQGPFESNHQKFEGHFGAFSRSSRRLVCRPLPPWDSHFDETSPPSARSQTNVTRATTESYLPVAWTPDSLLSGWPGPPLPLSPSRTGEICCASAPARNVNIISALASGPLPPLPTRVRSAS
jgi:hypothetical protein